MCGIAGYIDKSGRIKTNKEYLKKMTDTIAHRGPDAEGQWCDNKVALGHRRLSIIDLDAKSNQPLHSHDERFIITYNGEIYNYIELKQELKEHGAKFITDSDTEVIMEAYRHFGTACFNMFNGMWAFALYDTMAQQIIFSRDRFGIKPLYTIDRDDVFAFASEIKAILALLPEAAIPNNISIYRYLLGSINEDVDEECFFKNVKIFPPAHYMVYDLTLHRKEYHRYWEVDVKFFYDKWIDGKNPIQTFKELFDSAVELRLRADVEVGACLSGGVDSSSIVGCMAKKFGRKVHTFSSIYSDVECNEEPYIRKVNETWQTTPHYIKPDDFESDFTKYVDDLTYHHDQPTQGASLYSQYMVMKKAHGHVKVLLDGQGADELFAGYLNYYSYHIADLHERGGWLQRLKAIKLLTLIRHEWPDILDIIGTEVIIHLVGIKNSSHFQDNNEKNTDMKIKRSMPLFTEKFLQDLDVTPPPPDIVLHSRLNTRLCNDVIAKNIPNLLHNEDGNSMAFSLESRVPFLDYRLVEFALALDGDFKIKNEWTKWIVRRACREYLPKEIAERKNKMGFPAPFARWLRHGKDKDKVRDIIYAFGWRNIVPKETINRYYSAHIAEEADFNALLFKFFSMELWYRRMIDREGAA